MGGGFGVRGGRRGMRAWRGGMGAGGGGNSRSRFGNTGGGRGLRRRVHPRHGAGPGRGSGGGRFRTFGWMFGIRFAAVHEGGGGFSALSLSLSRGALFLQALATCPGSAHSKHLTDSGAPWTGILGNLCPYA